jgi:hypothetical protein
MAKRVALKEMRAILLENLNSRPELGLRKGIADLMLEPRNPFDPKAPRQPKKAFVLLVLFGALSISAFVYFNLLGWR